MFFPYRVSNNNKWGAFYCLTVPNVPGWSFALVKQWKSEKKHKKV
jgi:hypothetical protein